MKNRDSCSSCKYSLRKKLSSMAYLPADMGGPIYDEYIGFLCRLKPEAIEVEAKHWCGQYGKKVNKRK